MQLPREGNKSIKSVKFGYTGTPATKILLAKFRDMVNEALRIGMAENIEGRLRLRDRIYREFQSGYDVSSRYPYCVAEVAWSILKKHRRWHRPPRATRLMLKVDSENYTLNHGLLSIPFKKGERLMIPLRYGEYQRSFLVDSGLKRGSLTMTESNIIISFSSWCTPHVAATRIGVDLNMKSLVCSDGSKYDLSTVSRLHTEYGVRRREFYARHPGDHRLMKKFAGSRRERERVRQELHRVARKLVDRAKSGRQAVVLERLDNFRRDQRSRVVSRKARRRLSVWPYRLLQTFITYKATWEGVPIEFVSAAFTSKLCSFCGYLNRDLKLTEREWRCPSCGAALDRDLNAAVNIERRGTIPCLGVVRPGAQSRNEALRGEPRCSEAPGAEALKRDCPFGHSPAEPSSLVSPGSAEFLG